MEGPVCVKKPFQPAELARQVREALAIAAAR